MSKKGLIIIISGPSGVGKTTVTDRLIAEMGGIGRCITYTTRARRPGEKDGVDYYFVDDAAFTRLIEGRALAEWAIVNGYKYGTPRSEIERVTSSGSDVVLVIDVQGAASIKALYPEALSIFIKPPSLDTLRQRLGIRGEKDRVDQRLERAKAELSQAPRYDHVLVNDTIDAAVGELKALIEQCRQ